MNYTSAPALGTQDTHEVAFLFQRWTPERGWSKGEYFERLTDALLEQECHDMMRPKVIEQPTRILEVTTTVSYKSIVQ